MFFIISLYVTLVLVLSNYAEWSIFICGIFSVFYTKLNRGYMETTFFVIKYGKEGGPPGIAPPPLGFSHMGVISPVMFFW